MKYIILSLFLIAASCNGKTPRSQSRDSLHPCHDIAIIKGKDTFWLDDRDTLSFLKAFRKAYGLDTLWEPKDTDSSLMPINHHVFLDTGLVWQKSTGIVSGKTVLHDYFNGDSSVFFVPHGPGRFGAEDRGIHGHRAKAGNGILWNDTVPRSFKMFDDSGDRVVLADGRVATLMKDMEDSELQARLYNLPQYSPSKYEIYDGDTLLFKIDSPETNYSKLRPNKNAHKWIREFLKLGNSTGMEPRHDRGLEDSLRLAIFRSGRTGSGPVVWLGKCRLEFTQWNDHPVKNVFRDGDMKIFGDSIYCNKRVLAKYIDSLIQQNHQ